jgi:hypothetical protein
MVLRRSDPARRATEVHHPDLHGGQASRDGRCVRGKQNNFRVKDVFERPLAWSQFLADLETFLLPAGATGSSRG